MIRVQLLGDWNCASLYGSSLTPPHTPGRWPFSRAAHAGCACGLLGRAGRCAWRDRQVIYPYLAGLSPRAQPSASGSRQRARQTNVTRRDRPRDSRHIDKTRKPLQAIEKVVDCTGDITSPSVQLHGFYVVGGEMVHVAMAPSNGC